LLAPWDLAHAKIAHRQNYPIAANWKLTVENYCECYHCLPAHPEYSVGHGRAIPRKDWHTIVSRATDSKGVVQPTVAELARKKTFLEDNSQFPRTVMIA
jgi:phenylpropionate dioxygenase-like ring-hydroxylating dioxygenase large terminal subunit